MEGSKKEKNGKCEMVDIQQFLNSSRVLVRQIKLLSHMEIEDKYLKLTKEAAKEVAISATKWSE